MNRELFETGGIYHVYNRGSDKRAIFLDTADHIRFTRGLFEFNDKFPARDPRVKIIAPRKKLVELLCYCLMPNHFHLMLRQLSDGGITDFMRKLGTGYTMYFNKRHDRSGVLFQGAFKSVPVQDDIYVRYLPHYIHLNPLEIGVSPQRMDSYRWSSYAEYANAAHGLADQDFLRDLYQPQSYAEALADWMREKDARSIAAVTLD